MIRAFIAIAPPASLRSAFAEVQANFQEVLTSWRWVPQEHIHLTLKFLGDVTAENLVQIMQSVAQAVTGQGPFSVQARAVGCFPQPSRPRLLWMGLHDPDGTLARLQHRIEIALKPLGLAPEPRPFHPHLTLARLSQGQRDKRLASLIHLYQERLFGEFPVTECQVFQSHLYRHGAVYTPLQTIPL